MKNDVTNTHILMVNQRNEHALFEATEHLTGTVCAVRYVKCDAYPSGMGVLIASGTDDAPNDRIISADEFNKSFYNLKRVDMKKKKWSVKLLPKRIRKKCERIEKLCDEANMLRHQVEEWCQRNGIDTASEAWYEEAVYDIGGCASTLFANGIEVLLNSDAEVR